MQNKDFFGRVYADIMRDSKIPLEAKGLYAYLAVLCGSSDRCFPGVNTILSELQISRDTFYKYMAVLISAGVVDKCQGSKKDGKFGPVVYHLVRDKESCPKNADTAESVDGKSGLTVSEFTDSPYTVNSETKDKAIKDTSLKRCQRVIELFNTICKSFPKVRKISDSRKKSINARFNSGYSFEDFEKTFQMAEESTFLKGRNARNWQADFDWLISDRNMVKVLEGKYSDRKDEAKNDRAGNTGFKLF